MKHAVVAVVLLLLATGALAGRPPVILATTVSWTDADGRTGSAQFQGSARGRKLTGILQGGNQEVRVRGTIERDGRIAGSLAAPDGSDLGTFTARVDAQGHLEGTWLVDGSSAGALSAPADGLVRGRGSSVRASEACTDTGSPPAAAPDPSPSAPR